MFAALTPTAVSLHSTVCVCVCARALQRSLKVDKGCELFRTSLVVLTLHFGQFAVSPGHPLGEKSSAELCARLRTFSLRKLTVAEETESHLETSQGTARLPAIVSHPCPLV